jgi:hypothetical protein
LVSSGLRDDNNSINVLLRKLWLTPHFIPLTPQTRSRCLSQSQRLLIQQEWGK